MIPRRGSGGLGRNFILAGFGLGSAARIRWILCEYRENVQKLKVKLFWSFVSLIKTFTKK